MFKTGRVPFFVSTFVFFLNKNRYKNKCGGDLLKSPIANSFEISPPTSCTSLTVQHAEDQDKWNLEKDGWTSCSTKPILISLSSLFFLFKRWFVQHYPQIPSFLSLKNCMLIIKIKLNELCQSTCALHALPWINLHTLYSLLSF